MKKLSQKFATTAALAFGILAGSSNAAHAQTAYAIADGGASLISFDVAAPGTILNTVAFSGGNGFLDAIDFRPLTGGLYGYNDATDTLYTVNTTSGLLEAVASSAGTAGATAAFGTGLDFNPAIDRVRVVNDADQNRVYNPNNANPATNDTTPAPNTVFNLAYAAGDASFGVDPNIVENAYNNNRAGSAGTQFAIDYVQGNLVTLANNTGVLTTRGSLGLAAISQAVGFDIFTNSSGTNFAYALLDTSDGGNSLGTSQQLYSINIDLTPGNALLGQATLVGALGNNSSVYSLAITPTVVPEAGTLPLLVGGVMTMGLGIVVRRRNKK